MPLPGNLSKKDQLARMLRVNQAGEYGAKRIYAGQLAVLKHHPNSPIIQHMAEQEEVHLAEFNRLVKARGVRPTALQPLWHVGGWMMGAASALLGEKAAMACTVAVESVINDHYARQREQLMADFPEEQALANTIEKFRLEEVEHHDIGLEKGAEDSPFYGLLSTAIKTKTRMAIWLSERF
jgi:3-demethoxyubiquinol 3-hydroxylase